jgi:hypothetical protein
VIKFAIRTLFLQVMGQAYTGKNISFERKPATTGLQS